MSYKNRSNPGYQQEKTWTKLEDSCFKTYHKTTVIKTLWYWHKNIHIGTSLVVQWLRIRLPVQGTRVQALVREDPTCHEATKPMYHNYWGCALEPTSHNYWSPHATTTEAHAPTAGAPQQEKPSQWETHTLQWRVAPARCTTRESPYAGTKTQHSQK